MAPSGNSLLLLNKAGWLRPPHLHMNIYLEHPLHGQKVATMELEAEEDEKNGWVRYTLDTPENEVAEPVNALKRRRKTTE
jgi:hypothetical protein